ncbi:MAG: hypothetical protein GDA48_09895 [Hormoscilla sp. GM102CHS1]|nr:hypothetical protein [Hormoscilla sp. GM102CHS1]
MLIIHVHSATAYQARRPAQRCTRRKMAYPCRAALRIAQLAIVHSHAFWELVVWDNWVDSTDRYRTAKLVMAKMS